MAKRGRSVEKEAYWRDVLSRHVSSGLSVRAFCRAQAVDEASFFAWRRTLADRDSGESASPKRPIAKRPPAVNFVPAVIQPPREISVVLELASGHTLKLPPSTPVSELVQLVLALESRGDR